uniref:Uncharacterized protein n=1 Tax=Clastoptera arizonana TaxID=38151 RepID=A0A1B6E521_9HEMI
MKRLLQPKHQMSGEYNIALMIDTFGDVLYRKIADILNLPLPDPEYQTTSFETEHTITSFVPEDFIEPEEVTVEHPEDDILSSGSEYSEYTLESKEESLLSYSYVESEGESESSDDSMSSDDSQKIFKNRKPNPEVEKKRLALLKLLSLPIEEAATWRPKKIKTIDNMSLEERGNHLTNLIASDFCEWVRSLGGDEQSEIDENMLKELFEVRMENPATRSVAIQIREKNVLYKKLADLFHLPEASFNKVLLKQLKSDFKAGKELPRLKAFGRALPVDLQFIPPKSKIMKSWPQHEDHFEDVFRDIADLSSTKEYCNFLIKNPMYKKPKYLQKIGRFSEAQDIDSDTRTVRKIVSEIISKSEITGLNTSVLTMDSKTLYNVGKIVKKF